MQQVDNKRIAKNTLFLYFRMFLVMGVSLFTFRLLLLELGEQNYGIYNVVAGVVVLFSFMSNALTQSTQRYISYHLGLKDLNAVSRIFSMAMNVHIVISLVVVLLAETLGLWLLNTYMTFPEGTMTAVNIVYQVSILTFVIQLLTVPYQASIVSYEKMSFYAYLSITEVTLRLLSVVALIPLDDGKLIFYSVAVSLSTLIVFFIYKVFCNRTFTTTRYHFFRDAKLFRELTSFSGWNMLGGFGNVTATQGVNIIFNIFCGVAVNAAMGVANQVCTAVTSFVTNMQAAFNPQIVKSYAAECRSDYLSLIFRSTRLAFLLIFMIGFPIILYTPEIFELWLSESPEYAVGFTRLILIFCMFDALSGPLWTIAQASGKIKVYMIVISLLIISNIPVTLLLLSQGFEPTYAMLYKVFTGLLIYIFRILYLGRVVQFPVSQYLRHAVFPVIIYVVASLPPALIARAYINGVWISMGALAITAFFCACLGFFITLTSEERRFILSKIQHKVNAS